MRAICIDDKTNLHYNLFLTINKVYQLIGHHKYVICVINDSDEIMAYNTSRFKLLRDINLEKLCPDTDSTEIFRNSLNDTDNEIAN